MDDIKIRVIDSKKLIEAINTSSYEIDLSAVMALGAVVTQSASQWIPCSERLPKKDGDYLVTTHSGQIARYIFIGGSSEEYWRRCAKAWMPLPQPYKEAQNDER